MILVIDNYDSFAYNLVQYVGEYDEVVVRRNDTVSIDDIQELDPDGIIVSPGPGSPEEAGISIDIFRHMTIPTLGVCLGHQALCAAHGATVGSAPEVVHGKKSIVTHDESVLFDGIPSEFEVGRYHSLAISEHEIPSPLVQTAITKSAQNVVMGVQHPRYPHYGVQFHPESILTTQGKQIICNFSDIT
jgi:anthranilate synthase component 2